MDLVWRDVQHTLTSFHSSKFTAVLAGALLFALIFISAIEAAWSVSEEIN
jgi:hypothetical protein